MPSLLQNKQIRNRRGLFHSGVYTSGEQSQLELPACLTLMESEDPMPRNKQPFWEGTAATTTGTHCLNPHQFPVGLAIFLEVGVCINKNWLQTPDRSWMLIRFLIKINAKMEIWLLQKPAHTTAVFASDDSFSYHHWPASHCRTGVTTTQKQAGVIIRKILQNGANPSNPFLLIHCFQSFMKFFVA